MDTSDSELAAWLPDEPGEFDDLPPRVIALPRCHRPADDVSPDERRRLLDECEYHADQVTDPTLRDTILAEAVEHRHALGYPEPLTPKIATQSASLRAPRRAAPRARQTRRTRRRAAARSPGREDAGPEPPPALAGKSYTLTCEADDCGVTFVSSRPHTRTCSHRCRQRVHVARTGLDKHLLRLSDLARSLVASGDLEPIDALALVIRPTPGILAALIEAGA